MGWDYNKFHDSNDWTDVADIQLKVSQFSTVFRYFKQCVKCEYR